MNKKISPFVILPYGKKQSIVFYGSTNIRMDEKIWKDLVFGDFVLKHKTKRVTMEDISNGNTVIVYRKRKTTHIFHIYPTDYVEKFSGRRGLCFIVGFCIDYGLLKKQPKQIANALTCFFNAISCCCNDYMSNDDISIPTRFVTKVNVGAYNNYIQHCLSEADYKMQELLVEENNNSLTSNKIYSLYDKISQKCRFNNILYFKNIF